MEYQFENIYTLSQAQMIEYYKAIYKQNTKINIVGLAFCLILLLYAAFILNFDRFWLMLLSFSGALLFVQHIKRPEKEGKRAYTQLLEYYDSSMIPTSVYFGEKITIHNQDQTRVIEYRKIEKVVSMKYSYAIYDKKPGVLLLDPNGFTKGSFEGFKQFLREKRPDLKIPE